MHFDGGQIDRGDGVTQRVGIVRIGCGIDNYSLRPSAVFLEEINERAFAVCLERAHAEAEPLHLGADLGVQLGERRRAVNLGLARAEQIQIRPVQNQNSHALLHLVF